MKLSELLAKPFKLKGGSTLNLRGFSKRVVDKEVGEEGESTNLFSSIFDTLNYSNEYLQDKVVNINDTIIDVKEVTNEVYKLLYKKSFIESSESSTKIMYYINLQINVFYISTMSDLNIDEEFDIDGEIYCTLRQNKG